MTQALSAVSEAEFEASLKQSLGKQYRMALITFQAYELLGFSSEVTEAMQLAARVGMTERVMYQLCQHANKVFAKPLPEIRAIIYDGKLSDDTHNFLLGLLATYQENMLP